MQIEIIAEASTGVQKLLTGWGVSFLIDNDLLFDTFSDGEVLRKNFKKSGININSLKYVVISHDHWDHTGGLWYILENNPKVKVFICPGFSRNFKEKIRKFDVQVIKASNGTEIKPGMFTTGEIAGEYAGGPMPEQSLVIKQEKLSIITGCAHPGIVKIIDEVRKHFSAPINMVLGGFHLLDKNEVEIKQIVDKFKSIGVEKAAPCHCTGKEAVDLFKKEYKGNFIGIDTGLKITI